MEKAPKERPSMQLNIERNIVRKFRILCLDHNTTMSNVVSVWMRDALKTGKIPKAPPPKKSGPPRKAENASGTTRED